MVSPLPPLQQSPVKVWLCIGHLSRQSEGGLARNCSLTATLTMKTEAGTPGASGGYPAASRVAASQERGEWRGLAQGAVSYKGY